MTSELYINGKSPPFWGISFELNEDKYYIQIYQDTRWTSTKVQLVNPETGGTYERFHTIIESDPLSECNMTNQIAIHHNPKKTTRMGADFIILETKNKYTLGEPIISIKLQARKGSPWKTFSFLDFKVSTEANAYKDKIWC